MTFDILWAVGKFWGNANEPDLDILSKMALRLNVDLNYFADNKFKTLTDMPEPLPAPDEIVYIKILRTNSKRWAGADKLPFPKSLLWGLNADRLLIYEAHADIEHLYFSNCIKFIITLSHTAFT